MVKMGTVWDRTVEFLGDNLGTILPTALLAFFVPASITINLDVVMRSASRMLAAQLTLLELLFAFVSIWGTLTITGLAIGAQGQRAGAVARQRLFPALAQSILLGVGIALLAVPAVIILAMGGVDFAAVGRGVAPQIAPAAALAVSLYSILALVIGIWLVSRFSIAQAVLVQEGGALRSLARAWALTRGYALRIAGVLILLGVLAAVCRLAASTVFGSVFALLIGNDSEGLSLASVLTSIVTAAVQASFMTVFAVFLAKLYVALAARAPLEDEVLAA